MLSSMRLCNLYIEKPEFETESMGREPAYAVKTTQDRVFLLYYHAIR